jgi:hypothetical protein
VLRFSLVTVWASTCVIPCVIPEVTLRSTLTTRPRRGG